MTDVQTLAVGGFLMFVIGGNTLLGLAYVFLAVVLPVEDVPYLLMASFLAMLFNKLRKGGI